MRQRLPAYIASALALATFYLGCLSEGWNVLAAWVVALVLLGILVVAAIEHRIHERDCDVEHEGWRDAEHVREVLGTVPPERPEEITLVLPVVGDLDFRPDEGTVVIPVCRDEVEPLAIEEQAKAAVMQDQAVKADIHDRYTAQAEEGMRVVEGMAAEVDRDFKDAAWELGVA